MTRSLPEKTFEHWCSIHLNYRYRSHLQMWWPSSGADIDAAQIPQSAGKRIWLELKTVEWNSTASRHELFVDLKQLIAYGAEAIPDYYVFPVPRWEGVLGDSSSVPWLGALPVAHLAYQTRSVSRWFANWTFVVSGATLRRALAAKIASYLTTGRGETLRVATVSRANFAWVQSSLAPVTPIVWKSFWEVMERCGSIDYPAQFVIPTPPDTHASGLGGPLSNPPTAVLTPRASLVAQLKELVTYSERNKASGEANLSVYAPTASDRYVLIPRDGGVLGGEFVWNSSRALILIEAEGLSL